MEKGRSGETPCFTMTPARNVPITIAEYDPRWPTLFEREADKVKGLLGEAALRIEHVGSTAVPTLAAKPILDVLLVVRASGDEAAYAPALEAAGYVLQIREPDWFEHRMFKGPDPAVNLHVFSEGASEIERMIRFRDHLRSNPTDRALYEATKRDLARRSWRHIQDYADAKNDVIREIYRRAVSTASAAPGQETTT